VLASSLRRSTRRCGAACVVRGHTAKRVRTGRPADRARNRTALNFDGRGLHTGRFSLSRGAVLALADQPAKRLGILPLYQYLKFVAGIVYQYEFYLYVSPPLLLIFYALSISLLSLIPVSNTQKGLFLRHREYSLNQHDMPAAASLHASPRTW
jgi:hypothetical protein